MICVVFLISGWTSCISSGGFAAQLLNFLQFIQVSLVSVRDIQTKVRIFDCCSSLQVPEQSGRFWCQRRVFENCCKFALGARFTLTSRECRESARVACSLWSSAGGSRCKQIGGMWIHYQVGIQRL